MKLTVQRRSVNHKLLKFIAYSFLRKRRFISCLYLKAKSFISKKSCLLYSTRVHVHAVNFLFGRWKSSTIHNAEPKITIQRKRIKKSETNIVIRGFPTVYTTFIFKWWFMLSRGGQVGWPVVFLVKPRLFFNPK